MQSPSKSPSPQREHHKLEAPPDNVDIMDPSLVDGKWGATESGRSEAADAWTVPFLLFPWVTSVFWRGRAKAKAKQPLENEDLLVVPEDERSRAVYHDVFLPRWEAEKKRTAAILEDRMKSAKTSSGFDESTESGSASTNNSQPNLARVLFSCWKTQLLIGAITRLISDACQIGIPFLLKELIEWLYLYSIVPDGHLQQPELWKGYVWALALGVDMIVIGLANNACMHYTMTAFMNMKTAVTLAIFDKALNLGGSHGLTSNIVSMATTDTTKFIEGSMFMQNAWSAPIMAIAALGALYYFIGWAGVLSIVVILITIPMQGFLAKTGLMQRSESVKAADSRLQVVHEFIQGIRIVKFMGWESEFMEKTADRRRVELSWLQKLFVTRAIFVGIVTYSPMVVIFVVIALAYRVFDQEINGATIFPAMAMLNVLRAPITLLPLAIMRLVEVKVAMHRVAAFLRVPDHTRYVQEDATMEDGMLLQNADIQCLVAKPANPVEESPTEGGTSRGTTPQASPLVAPETGSPKIENEQKDIDSVHRETLMTVDRLTVPRGGLTIVVGATASGKSTLVSALIGEALVGRKTSAKRCGSLAYVSQDPWIINATLRDNITLGRAYDEQRYAKAIGACQLLPDLQQLSGSDQTEIGERGINLSGGQKQRVAFARAVYSNTEIVVMDDPLSAVDPSVCASLFHGCVCGALAGKTRVLVTHQQQFLPFADRIVLVAERKIVFVGTHDELNDRPEFHDLLGPSQQSGATSPKAQVALHQREAEPPTGPIVIPEPKEEGQDLVSAEMMESGDVSIRVFFWYIKLIGVGLWLSFVLLYAAWRTAALIAELLMSWWASRDPVFGHTLTQDQYLQWYGIAILATGFLVMIRQVPFVASCVRVSRNAHEVLVRRLLQAPLSFFDTTPTGRILNRFSKDMEVLDNVISESLNFFYNVLFVLIGAYALMINGLPWIAIAIVCLLCVFGGLYAFYVTTNSAIKRLDSVNRSPIAVTLTELLGGLSSIRAYGLTGAYRSRHATHFSSSIRSGYTWRVVQRWLGVRVDIVSALIGLATAVLGVAIVSTMEGREARLERLAMMNLAITYGVGMANAMGFITQMAADLAANFSSVERIREYTESVPSERTLEYTEPGGALPPPPPSWPAKGTVAFENVSLRYRPGLPLVLKNVTFTVPAGAKVGVVGRTGSGKSTVMLALFRLVELADEPGEDGGRVLIDDIDIAKLKLVDLRSKITIIPQDPVLFIGTVRRNVDPFNKHEDDRVWNALEMCGMGERVQRDAAGLDAAVEEKGANFSVGERQLLCMARALLRDCRVLLLDEATASIDPQQDAVLQRTIRTAFAHCTVLTIAHRVATIIDSDRVLVLDGGSVAEYGVPAELLRRPDGAFAAMLEKLGPEMEESLKKAAAEHETTVVK